MNKQLAYIQFPLYLLRNLFKDKNATINTILTYGIYRFSTTIKYDINEVARQLMYGYYRGDLTNDLRPTMEMYINADKLPIDEDYNGFAGNTFDPEYSLTELHELFNDDPDFKNKAIEFYQIKQAYSFLKLTGDFNNCIKQGLKLEKSIPSGEPLPMINTKHLFAFRDNNKTEFDLMQFACYVGFRSIIGIKPYSKTNKQMILCRAFGYSSIKQLPKEPPELYKKYSKRYHIDKIISFLELNWGVLTYSNNMRGIYVANVDKMTIEQLAIIAETKKQTRRLNEIKNKKRDAKEKAIQQLNKGQPLNKEY
ncbi:MAG: hypothetical protein WCX31_14355 [Salinivirgaceae bacterium]